MNKPNFYGKNYRIIDSQNSTFCDQANIYNLEEIILNLYDYLFHIRNVNLDSLQIGCFYMNIPVSIFKINFNNGLILYNEENYFKAVSICPELTATDLLLQKIFCNQTTNIVPKKNII